MDTFLSWLATSPLGGIFKVGLSGMVVYALENISQFNLDPTVQALATAVLTVAVNYLNPADDRYGKDKTVTEDSDGE